MLTGGGVRGRKMRQGAWRAAALLMALAALPPLALAHGGRLDAQGCHHNRKTGGYHCHRGGTRLVPPVPPAPARVKRPRRATSAPAAPHRPSRPIKTSPPLARSVPCYCQGFSGYRLRATGQCVAIAKITRLCGIPPERKCSFETPHGGAGAGRCPKDRGKAPATTPLY